MKFESLIKILELNLEPFKEFDITHLSVNGKTNKIEVTFDGGNEKEVKSENE